MLGAELALRQCHGNEVREREAYGALAPPFTGADHTGRTRDVCPLTTGGLISVRQQAYAGRGLHMYQFGVPMTSSSCRTTNPNF